MTIYLKQIVKNIFKVTIPKYYTEDDECYNSGNEQSVFSDIEEIEIESIFVRVLYKLFSE